MTDVGPLQCAASLATLHFSHVLRLHRHTSAIHTGKDTFDVVDVVMHVRLWDYYGRSFPVTETSLLLAHPRVCHAGAPSL